MNIFYHTNIPIQGAFELSEEESKHCVKVLRMHEDELISVIDGVGHKAIAKIIEPNPKRCLVEVVEFISEKKNQCEIHIAVAPTKNNDRMEWFVEKATEIGVSEISFLKCRNSERKEIKIERFAKIALSAIKQCNRLHLPKINEMLAFEKFITSNKLDQKFIAYCPVETTKLLSKSYVNKTSVLVLIGPEGDFSSDEVLLAIKQGFKEISLGSVRYRTETAALVACHTIDILNQ